MTGSLIAPRVRTMLENTVEETIADEDSAKAQGVVTKIVAGQTVTMTPEQA
ncbi:MAG: hypothetical protein QOI90_3466, partial [Mycobacterium sp.]|nr:hypothetical protein [Mycobacterium sp.]